MLQVTEFLGCSTLQSAILSHHGVPDPRLTAGVTAQTPGDAAVGPPIVRCFLPPARPQHREEDKQPLIWAPQAASLFPSTPAPTAPGTGRARAARGSRGSSIPLGGQAGPGAAAGIAPGRAGMPAEGMVPGGHCLSVPREGNGLQHYVRIR